MQVWTVNGQNGAGMEELLVRLMQVWTVHSQTDAGMDS